MLAVMMAQCLHDSFGEDVDSATVTIKFNFAALGCKLLYSHPCGCKIYFFMAQTCKDGKQGEKNASLKLNHEEI